MLLSRSSVASARALSKSALDEGTMKNSALQLTNQIAVFMPRWAEARRHTVVCSCVCVCVCVCPEPNLENR